MALTDDEKREMEEMMIRICREVLLPEVSQFRGNDKEETVSPEEEDAQIKESIIEDETKEEEPALYVKKKEALLISIAGAKPGVGVTHHAIVIARALQSIGVKIALMDMSKTLDLSQVKQDYLEGLPFYRKADVMQLDKIAYDYDVIVIDMGHYAPEIRSIFNRCDKKIIVAGGALWESQYLEPLYLDNVERYYFIFNNVPDDQERRKSIEMGMSPLKVTFSHYMPEPLSDTYEIKEIFDLLELDVM